MPRWVECTSSACSVANEAYSAGSIAGRFGGGIEMAFSGNGREVGCCDQVRDHHRHRRQQVVGLRFDELRGKCARAVQTKIQPVGRPADPGHRPPTSRERVTRVREGSARGRIPRSRQPSARGLRSTVGAPSSYAYCRVQCAVRTLARGRRHRSRRRMPPDAIEELAELNVRGMRQVSLKAADVVELDDAAVVVGTGQAVVRGASLHAASHAIAANRLDARQRALERGGQTAPARPR